MLLMTIECCGKIQWTQYNKQRSSHFQHQTNQIKEKSIAAQDLLGIAQVFLSNHLNVQSFEGSILAAGYGALAHSGWCSHRGFVHLWAVFKKNLRTQRKPQLVGIQNSTI